MLMLQVFAGTSTYGATLPLAGIGFAAPSGYTFDTQEDYDRAYREMSLQPEQVEQPLDAGDPSGRGKAAVVHRRRTCLMNRRRRARRIVASLRPYARDCLSCLFIP